MDNFTYCYAYFTPIVYLKALESIYSEGGVEWVRASFQRSFIHAVVHVVPWHQLVKLEHAYGEWGACPGIINPC